LLRNALSRSSMRTRLWRAAALFAWFSCGGDGPTPPMPPVLPAPSPFGLDTRPANATCLAKQRPVLDTSVTLTRQWPGVTFLQPVLLTQAPGDNTQWFVVEREGAVLALPSTATSDAETHFLVKVQSLSSGEGGLLGLAFHPKWPA